MTRAAVFVGGPEDGRDFTVDRFTDRIVMPGRLIPHLNLAEPAPDLPFPRHTYVLAFAAGHPSLDDQGRLRYVHKGERSG